MSRFIVIMLPYLRKRHAREVRGKGSHQDMIGFKFLHCLNALALRGDLFVPLKNEISSPVALVRMIRHGRQDTIVAL